MSCLFRAAPLRNIGSGEIIDLTDAAEHLDLIAPTVGRLRGDRIISVDTNDPVAVSKARAAINDRYGDKNKPDDFGSGSTGSLSSASVTSSAT